MVGNLTPQQLDSIKKSYLNILAFFLQEQKIESRYLRCLLKWGFQLNITPEDLTKSNTDVTHLAFTQPGEKLERLEAIYHLIYMIYLDEVVEDVELEVATIYSKKLGFKPDVVSELFKSIATFAYDEEKPRDVKKEIMDFLKLYDA